MKASSINLQRVEQYDCTKENVWSYRKSTDERDGIKIGKLGNMTNGYPFPIGEVMFRKSECAYIAGAYSNDDPDSIRIQHLISQEKNGYLAKRIYRNKPEFTQHIRPDWNDYNVQWMMYVIWMKCTGNAEFADILRQIPVDAQIVENTSLHTGKTSSFWGAKNPDLMKARKLVEDDVARSGSFRFNNQMDHAKMIAANQVNDVGEFVGQNVMGKILKMCSLALINCEVPLIDINLLTIKNICMMGHPINYDPVA